MSKLKGTQTEQNLLKSFAGESQARNRYNFAAKVADKEGYLQIAAIFRETEDNERVHAKTMYKHLEGGMLEITATYPAGKIGNTLENLKDAAEGEHEEMADLYPAFAETADKEGFPEIAKMYREIAEVEGWHEKRFRKLAQNIEDGTVFKKGVPVKWKCRNCGYVHEGPGAPDKCPACLHPQKYFELYADNY